MKRRGGKKRQRKSSATGYVASTLNKRGRKKKRNAATLCYKNFKQEKKNRK
jgi:hypothetical protein